MTKVTIPNKFNNSSTLIITPSEGGYDTPEVHVHVTGGGLPMLNTRRADFIAGVEEALGGTFIEDTDMPEVTDYGTGIRSGLTHVNKQDGDVSRLREVANEFLALARWLDANPEPVIDQEQVEAFKDAFEDAGANFTSAGFNAEALVKAGYKITKEV